MIHAPVLIPTLNRYDSFTQCLNSLERCTGADKTDVYIALDYPPTERYVEGWKKIDAYLREKELKNGFANLVVFRRKTNCGVLNPNSNGTQLRRYVEQYYDRYIISEDDNVFSPNFLEYINKGLEQYENDSEIFAISGYSNPLCWKISEGATCLKQNWDFSAWGTAYWVSKRKAVAEDISSGLMLGRVEDVWKKSLYKKMLVETQRGYFSQALAKTINTNSWYLKLTDVALTAYLPIYGKYVIMPTISKVRNMGFDGSGDTCPDFTRMVLDNSHVSRYNFSKQPIDSDDYFVLKEDTLCAIDYNRKLNDKFKKRPFNYRLKLNITKVILSLFGFSIGRRIVQIL